MNVKNIKTHVYYDFPYVIYVRKAIEVIKPI